MKLLDKILDSTSWFIIVIVAGIAGAVFLFIMN